MIHQHSRMAWRDFPEGQRRRDVCDAIYGLGRPVTDREVCGVFGTEDMNYVRPAITHLIKDGILEETGSTVCQVTDRTVRLVYFAKDLPLHSQTEPPTKNPTLFG